jgi:hypothetical protein
MTEIQNTTRAVQENPAYGLFASMGDGITEMEAAGQSQLIQSTKLPAELSYSTRADFEALGFVFGDLVDGDPLFRETTLPAGWTKRATDHSMHSEIVDERGIARVGVFYKAAFYDRRADMNITNVGSSVATECIYGDGDPSKLPERLTRDELLEAEGHAIYYVRRAGDHPDIYAERLPRVDAFLTAVRSQLGGAE